MSEIRPIETEYDGRLFRSRLEARWAVFFREASIRYLYEHEGYVLPDGTRYLPDFYLPDIGLFVEIKPLNPTPHEKHKLSELIKSTGARGTFLGSIPEPFSAEWPEIENYTPAIYEMYEGALITDWPYYFCECATCSAIGYEFDGRSDRLPCKESYDRDGKGCPRSAHGDKGYNASSRRLVGAYDVARKARFEFGGQNAAIKGG